MPEGGAVPTAQVEGGGALVEALSSRTNCEGSWWVSKSEPMPTMPTSVVVLSLRGLRLRMRLHIERREMATARMMAELLSSTPIAHSAAEPCWSPDCLLTFIWDASPPALPPLLGLELGARGGEGVELGSGGGVVQGGDDGGE